MNKDYINKLVQADRDKVGKFLAVAESGAVRSGLTPEQQRKQREYVQRQADIYSNAAFRATNKGLKPTDPAYLDNVREMNGVRNNLENLATQQKAIEKNQKQFLDDFNEGRISKANYADGSTMPLVNIYSGKANMEIDDYGNLMFEDGLGEFKPYTQLADYSLKSYDTANSLLSDIEKIADSKKGLSDAQMGLFKNKIATTINEASRSDVLSMISDGLLPGLDDLEIPEDLTNPENIGQLKSFIIETIGNAGVEINDSFFTPSGSGSGSDSGSDSDPSKKTEDGYVMGSNTGIPLDQRQSYFDQITNLEAGDKIKIEGFSGSNDPKPTRKGGRGKVDYTIVSKGDGTYAYLGIDSKTNKEVTSGEISEAQLKLEMLGEGSGDPLVNAEVVDPGEAGSSEDNPATWTPSGTAPNVEPKQSEGRLPTFKNVNRGSLDRMTIQGSSGSNKANILRDGKPISSKKSGITVTGVRAEGNDVVVDAKFLGMNQTGDLGRFKQSGNGFKFVPGEDYEKLGKSPKDKKDFDNFIRAVESDPRFAGEVLASVRGNKDFLPKNY